MVQATLEITPNNLQHLLNILRIAGLDLGGAGSGDGVEGVDIGVTTVGYRNNNDRVAVLAAGVDQLGYALKRGCTASILTVA